MQNYKEIYYGDQEEDVDNGDEVKFVACGKNEILDADMNYSLNQNTFAKINLNNADKKEEEKKDGDKKISVGEKRAY